MCTVAAMEKSVDTLARMALLSLCFRPGLDHSSSIGGTIVIPAALTAFPLMGTSLAI